MEICNLSLMGIVNQAAISMHQSDCSLGLELGDKSCGESVLVPKVCYLARGEAGGSQQSTAGIVIVPRKERAI